MQKVGLTELCVCGGLEGKPISLATVLPCSNILVSDCTESRSYAFCRISCRMTVAYGS
jgi:hypothetical protein